MRRPLSMFPVLTVALLVAASSCSDTAQETAAALHKAELASMLASPSGSTFYDGPKTMPSGKPGKLVWAHPIKAPTGAHAWRILYKSKSISDEDILVSGVLVVPDGQAPAGGRPVVTWAHGTTGTADVCAPSKEVDVATKLPEVAEFVKKGFVVVATDYEGLGTSGLHPYLVGESEGRGVLDAARAARSFPSAHAGTKAAIYGYSQGGHAAVFAGQIAETYAPDLDIVGDVAGAPVGNLKLLLAVASGIPSVRGLAIMAGFGFQAAYPAADPSQLLTPEAYQLGRVKVDQMCAQEFGKVFADPAMAVYTKSPLDVAPWPDLLDENTPGGAKVRAPVLALQGLDDQLVSPAITVDWMKRACALGTQVELKTYPGQDHGGGYQASHADAANWIEDRFAGKPFVDGCSTTP